VYVYGIVSPGEFREEVEVTGTEIHEFTIDLR
jgi:hypothetical protein